MNEFLILSAIQIIGICFIGYIHIKATEKNLEALKEIAMFKKASCLNDLAAMKNMDINSEDWDKKVIVEEEIPKSINELSQESIDNIANNI